METIILSAGHHREKEQREYFRNVDHAGEESYPLHSAHFLQHFLHVFMVHLAQEKTRGWMKRNANLPNIFLRGEYSNWSWKEWKVTLCVAKLALLTWYRWHHIPHLTVGPGHLLKVEEEAVDDAEEALLALLLNDDGDDDGDDDMHQDD